MKKSIIMAVFFICVSSAVFAQGFYFDIGLGIGPVITEINGQDVFNELKFAGASVDEKFGQDFSIKIGYGPFNNIPLYILGELGIMGQHKIDYFYDWNDQGSLYFQSGILGIGVIYYLTSLIQMGFSIGFSDVFNQAGTFAKERYDIEYNSKNGFAWNATIAFDLGQRKYKHGCLIGLKFSQASNTLEKSNLKQDNTSLVLFVKYAFRDKSSAVSLCFFSYLEILGHALLSLKK